jgi:hypothetical protein
MDVFIAFLAADLPHGVILPILANGPILAIINTYTFPWVFRDHFYQRLYLCDYPLHLRQELHRQPLLI